MNNNVELCSDWLFHSADNFSSSQEGNTGKIYISIFSCAVMLSGNYTVNKNVGTREPLLICWALKLLSNAQSHFTFTFEIHNCTNSVYSMEWQYLPHILQDQMLCSGSVNHSPSSSVISPYSVYVVSEIL